MCIRDRIIIIMMIIIIMRTTTSMSNQLIISDSKINWLFKIPGWWSWPLQYADETINRWSTAGKQNQNGWAGQKPQDQPFIVWPYVHGIVWNSMAIYAQYGMSQYDTVSLRMARYGMVWHRKAQYGHMHGIMAQYGWKTTRSTTRPVLPQTSRAPTRHSFLRSIPKMES